MAPRPKLTAASAAVQPRRSARLEKVAGEKKKEEDKKAEEKLTAPTKKTTKTAVGEKGNASSEAGKSNTGKTSRVTKGNKHAGDRKKGGGKAKQTGRSATKGGKRTTKGQARVNDGDKEVSNNLKADDSEAADPVVGNLEVIDVEGLNLEAIPLRFTRSALQSAGALELPEAQLPSLTEAVHPIWHYEHFNWYGGLLEQEKIELYAAVVPALRLATHWIEAPYNEAFWLPLWYLQYDENNEDDEGTYLVTQLEPDRAKALAGCTVALFQDFAARSNLVWQFHPLRWEEFGWATTPPDMEALKHIGFTIRANGDPGHITVIHDDFQWLPRHPHRNPSTCVKLRLLFYLATHLVRELVWHVFCHKWRQGHPHGPEPPDRSKIQYQSKSTQITPPISPRTMLQRPSNPPAAQPPTGALKVTEVSLDPQNGPEPPERSRVRYQFENDGSDALGAAWEISEFGGAIWRISPVTGPLPNPGVPDGFATQIIEEQDAEKDAAEDAEGAVDDDDSTDFYVPFPMSYINDLFSGQYWSEIERGVKRDIDISKIRARTPAIEPEKELVEVD